jgi:hypothetical protein
MPGSSPVIVASLGRGIAAFTARSNGQPVAVINSEAAHNPELLTQAGYALVGAGLDAGTALGALNGVRRRPLAQEEAWP